MAGLYSQAQGDSPESKVFRRHYAELVSAIQDPESLADGFFSRNVIGMGLLQEVQLEGLTKVKKSRKLLLVVQDQLVVNPCKFTVVVEALQGYGTLESTVEKLQSDYLVATQKPNLEHLEVELRHVHGWVHLGLCLDLPKHSLDEIHASHGSGIDALGKCKIKMLAMWLKRCKNPTWSTFIAALLDARLWSTASKIAAKYGIELPSKVLPKGKVPQQIEDIVRDVQQGDIIIAMRENVELKHMELHEINEGIEQNEKEIQMLENELRSINNSQQSKKKYTGLLMSDLQVQQLESAFKEDEKQQLELQMRQLELRQTPVPEEVRKQFHQAEESIASCQCKSSQLESQIKSLRQASSELARQLEHMSSNVDDIANELEGLQTQKKELLQDVHMREQELDSYLLGKSTTAPFVPANTEVAYYNIMMCAGRVEVKLRQSEIEECERKLMEKEVEVGNLRENLNQQQKMLQELKDRSLKEAKFKIQPWSSAYQYAYMHMQCKNEMEEYEMEQHMRKLQAENLQYKMQLAMAGSQKCALETKMQALIQDVATLKRAQAILEQRIEKSTPPVPPKPKTKPPVPPKPKTKPPVLPKPKIQLPPPYPPPPRNKPSLSEEALTQLTGAQFSVMGSNTAQRPPSTSSLSGRSPGSQSKSASQTMPRHDSPPPSETWVLNSRRHKSLSAERKPKPPTKPKPSSLTRGSSSDHHRCSPDEEDMGYDRALSTSPKSRLSSQSSIALEDLPSNSFIKQSSAPPIHRHYYEDADISPKHTSDRKSDPESQIIDDSAESDSLYDEVPRESSQIIDDSAESDSLYDEVPRESSQIIDDSAESDSLYEEVPREFMRCEETYVNIDFEPRRNRKLRPRSFESQFNRWLTPLPDLPRTFSPPSPTSEGIYTKLLERDEGFYAEIPEKPQPINPRRSPIPPIPKTTPPSPQKLSTANSVPESPSSTVYYTIPGGDYRGPWPNSRHSSASSLQTGSKGGIPRNHSLHNPPRGAKKMQLTGSASSPPRRMTFSDSSDSGPFSPPPAGSVPFQWLRKTSGSPSDRRLTSNTRSLGIMLDVDKHTYDECF